MQKKKNNENKALPVGFFLTEDPVIPVAARPKLFGRLIGAQTQLMITVKDALCTSAESCTNSPSAAPKNKSAENTFQKLSSILESDKSRQTVDPACCI